MSALLEQPFNSSGRRSMLKEHVQSIEFPKVQLYLLKVAGGCPNYGIPIGCKLIGVLSHQRESRVSLTALT